MTIHPCRKRKKENVTEERKGLRGYVTRASKPQDFG